MAPLLDSHSRNARNTLWRFANFWSTLIASWSPSGLPVAGDVHYIYRLGPYRLPALPDR
jgi:hypothetical protein